jgi:hypothetical protein
MSVEHKEWLRFQELQALAASPERHAVQPEVHAEYLRLLGKCGIKNQLTRVPVGVIALPSPIDEPHRTFQYDSRQCRSIPGPTPLACPRAVPKVHAEWLPEIQRTFHELKITPSEQSILWVGDQVGPENVCGYPRCGCFSAPAAMAAQPVEAETTASGPARKRRQWKDCTPPDDWHQEYIEGRLAHLAKAAKCDEETLHNHNGGRWWVVKFKRNRFRMYAKSSRLLSEWNAALLKLQTESKTDSSRG